VCFFATNTIFAHKNSMHKITLITALSLLSVFAFGQKLKEQKQPAGAEFKIYPEINIPEGSDAVAVNVEYAEPGLRQDSLSAWATAIATYDRSLRKVVDDSDIQIDVKLSQLDLQCADGYDPAAAGSDILTANLDAELKVMDSNGKLLVSSLIPYQVEHAGGMINNSFKPMELTVNFMLLKKLRKMTADEACKAMIDEVKSSGMRKPEDFYSGMIYQVRDTLQSKLKIITYDVAGGFYGFKKMDALTEAAETAANAVNATTALSKKKRLSIEEVRSILAQQITVWKKNLDTFDSEEMRDYLNYNLAFAYLIMEDRASAADHMSKIKKDTSGAITMGSFKDDVLKLKEYLSTYGALQSRMKLDSNS
jgi:hypothetical protein